MSDLAGRLREALELRGLGQNELEKKSGVPSGYVSLLVNGHRKKPGAGILAQLATALEVNYQWLATGVGEKESARETGRVAVADERYENRGRAVAMARELGYLARAIRDVQSIRLEGDDPPVRDWLEQIQRRDRELRNPFHGATGRALANDDDSTTRPRLPKKSPGLGSSRRR